MRVIIYSQVRLFGESLVHYLNACEDIAEVKFCHHAETLANDVIEFGADIVLIDMSGKLNLGEARSISNICPSTCLVAFAVPETADDVIACGDAGFVGYVSQQASLEELRMSLHLALNGECVCHPKIASSLLRELGKRCSRATDRTISKPLTNRESGVLALVARGLSNKEIACELVLSVATVKNHLHNIFSKLHVGGRTQVLVRLRNEPWLIRHA